jgi:hypothetical protein
LTDPFTDSGAANPPLFDYSGVIRHNATRYLVPGAILLQVVGEVERPLECESAASSALSSFITPCCR